jgi:hypothetical protein
MIGYTDIKSIIYFFHLHGYAVLYFFSVSKVNVGCKVGLWVGVLTFVKVLDVQIHS